MIGWLRVIRQRWVERQAYGWVMRMLDDPVGNASALERWLTKAPEHRLVYKRVAIEVGYASDAAVQMPSLRHRATQQAPASTQGLARRYLVPIGLSAVAILVAVMGWSMLSGPQHGRLDQLEEPQIIAIANGSKATRLADGSLLTLFGASSATVRYTGEERAIDLKQGRARFSVEHDPSRPFVVYVRGGKVTAVGTLFEVEAGKHVIVRLLNGQVIVTKPSVFPATAGKEVILSRGQQVRFTAPASAQEPPVPPASNGASREMQTFDDVPVFEILREANSRSSTKLVLSDAGIGEEKVFADLNVNDPQGVATKLAVLLNLRVDRSTPGEIRLSRAH